MGHRIMDIKQAVSLQDKNWFKTGGPARFFCQPTTGTEFAQALASAQQRNLDVFVLGQGANILISDDGFDGLVIHPQITNITINEDLTVTAGAGTSIQDLINYSLDHNLTGLEEFSGIPGTVGGSVYINIHYFEFLLSQFLVQATVIERTTGSLITVDNAWFGFGYDHSKLFETTYYIIDATFKLKHANPIACAYAKGRRDEIIRHRNNRYPRANTCGSFFRNFLLHEIPFEVKGKKVPFVAYYLDKIGIKGELAIGKAIVSYQHANMIVTQPGAMSADVIALARKMQELVQEKFGIVPHAECQLIGFKANPLL